METTFEQVKVGEVFVQNQTYYRKIDGAAAFNIGTYDRHTFASDLNVWVRSDRRI
jgi:hypothetical protein